MLNAFHQINLKPHSHNKSKWIYVLSFVAIFSLLAQWNIFSEIRPFYLSIGSLIALGFATAVLVIESSQNRLLLIFMSAILLYWLLAFPAHINGTDDNTAYLIFATDFYDSFEKTIQPLSERRLFSVGGLYAFQAPVIHWIGMHGLSLIEPVFGLMLFFIIINARLDRSPRLGAYILVGLVGIAPLAGSKVLANTSSVFMLSVFSLALLELGKDIWQKRNADWTQVSLLILLPLVASIFRPTTAPFNGLIALLLVFIVGFWIGGIRKIIILGVFGLSLFFFAVLPYHQIGGTYLYPILGRGFHITAQAYSIAQSITAENHIFNILQTAFFDPLFLLNSIIFLVLLKIDNQQKLKTILSVPYAIYVFFYLLIVISTGGLSSVRYIFPVSLAMAVYQLLIFFDDNRVLFSKIGKHALVLRVGWVTLVLAGLLIVRFTVGPAVIEKRLKEYKPNKDDEISIKAVQDIINSNGGASIFVHTGYERFLVENISRRYFIMDQPGMLSPWFNEKISYEKGLLNFIMRQSIRNIVFNTLHTPSCSQTKIVEGYHVGWQGIAKIAWQRNDIAFCNILKQYNIQVIGPFTLATNQQAKESTK